MSDRSENGLPASPGLERDPGGDEPWLARGPWNGNAIALACQVDELRQLNKRLELMNLGLGAHNRHLERQLDEAQARMQHLEGELHKAWAHSAFCEQRLGCLRYRLVDRLNNVARRVPLAQRVAKAGLKRTVRLARRIKARLRSRDSTPLALAPPPTVPEGDSALRARWGSGDGTIESAAHFRPCPSRKDGQFGTDALGVPASADVAEDLIYDIGMNNGDDTAFYLAMNYRVVAVEANPELVEQARRRFAPEIAHGRLHIINKAIAETVGTAKFWVNDVNSHWSSLIEWVGGRDGTTHHAIDVECITFEDILREYGIPHYLKIDIERADIYCIKALESFKRPDYISIQAHSVEYIDVLAALGYTEFKMIDQRRHNSNPKMEGKYIFPEGASGPFGEDSEGAWETEEEVKGRMARHLASWNETNPTDRTWYHFHARRRPL